MVPPLRLSRDQAHKIYVQNRMEESAAELWRGLDEGFSAASSTFPFSVSNFDSVEAMKKEKRYKRDVY